ncbi:site-specific DNA-methyltransferase [Acinetobacter baumannii]|uniref:site-specific DNA-methyltransferase n=1 Tax=Acinetobacter nosocomialis TaxID=106654 RepID=UPI0021BDC62E|nr:site-specific DNA-methyltransferase [Acinetobacter nosocomialis]MCT9423537.1 site-specific DNA-methyltransferase [Acinetobacter baumannii]MDC5131751.1 site-specific DNA-methyltransferase [Acinetobacter baumannii]MDN8574704.1 site-specific DNA-methyltransferase [Acinetobacter baumannii]
MGRPPVSNPKQTTTSIRMSIEEKNLLEQKANEAGFSSISEFLRSLVSQNTNKKESLHSYENTKIADPTKFFTTNLGTMWAGNSLAWMKKQEEDSVNLIMTSPPFGLVRKKTYGNEDAEEYCNWFRPFAEQFKRILKDDGSLVIDIGGAWKPGMPTRSLYHFKLLIMLCEEYGFHLALEHYWWNPSKLPTPAEWVNVRRVRPKDAVNCVWWLSKTPYPKTNNRRVLVPYSDSMKSLIKNGYQAKTRPSGHVISEKFGKDNGGAVPPNLLAIANTESNGTYQDYCRTNNIDIHPARFPSALPEYFIRMTTDPGDLVIDPFGGSCVTGSVSEALGRKWNCIELNQAYLEGAIGRFKSNEKAILAHEKVSSYSIYTPCAIDISENDTPLIADGGKMRAKKL